MWDIGKLFRLMSGRYRRGGSAEPTFKEVAPYEAGFALHYSAAVRPHVAQYETARLQALTKTATRFWMAVPVVGIISVLLVIFWVPTLEDPEGGMFTIAALVGVAAFYACRPVRRYKSDVKAQIFPGIISFLGDFSYSPTCKGRVDAFIATGLVPAFDVEKSEDEIHGLYNGVEIDFFETELKRKTRDSKGRVRHTTVFDGIFISFSFGKRFNGKTVVFKDMGTLGNWFKDTFSKLERVALEDPHFEKMFEVYADDQIEARYLLTPAFMERLKELVIKMAVRENLFEPGSIFEPEDFIDDSRRVLADMQHIFAILETLKLDETTGL
jgi:Protein of unknown function (DUF3137)